MSHKIILAVTAILSLTACTSGTTTDEINDKENNVPDTTELATLNGEFLEYLRGDGTGPLYYTQTKKNDLPEGKAIRYQGVALISPQYNGATQPEQQIAFTGTTEIALDFTNADGALSGKISNLREEVVKSDVELPKDSEGYTSFKDLTKEQIDEYFEIANTFSGDIMVSGTALRDGSLTANVNGSLTPTQGDTSAVTIQDTLKGGVYETGETNGTIGLESSYDPFDGDDQTGEPGNITSTNSAYNFSNITTTIFAK